MAEIDFTRGRNSKRLSRLANIGLIAIGFLVTGAATGWEYNTTSPLLLSPLFVSVIAALALSLWAGEVYLLYGVLIWAFTIGFFNFASPRFGMAGTVALFKWSSLIIATTVSFALVWQQQRKPRTRLPNIVKILSFYLMMYVILISLLSANMYVAMSRAISFAAVAFLVYYLIPRVTHSHYALEEYFKAILWAGNFILILSLLSYFDFLPRYEAARGRFQGLFGNPNGLGPWLNIAAMVNLFFLFRKKGTNVTKAGYIFFSATALFLLFYNNSRANYLGLAVGLLVLLMFAKRKFLWATFIALILGFSFFYQSFYGENIFSSYDWEEHLRLKSKYGVASGRMERWDAFVNEDLESTPWYGIGLGMGAEAVEKDTSIIGDTQRSRFLFDNSYINIWLEIGYPGLGIFLAWLISSLILLYRNATSNQDPYLKILSQLAFAMVLNFCAVSVFESFFATVGNIVSLSLWVLLALGVSKARRTRLVIAK